MSLNFDRMMFGLMYRIGFTPWDGHQLPSHLRKIVEGSGITGRKALDVGCGTGDTAIYLAQNGWDVTAVDFVDRALAQARAKSDKASVSVRYLRADATRLHQYDIGSGFDLVIDNGMLHGLSDSGRDAYLRDLTPLVTEGGRVFMLAFAAGKRRGPRGISHEEVRQRFSHGWQLVESGVDSAASNLRDDPIYFFDIRRTAAVG